MRLGFLRDHLDGGRPRFLGQQGSLAKDGGLAADGGIGWGSEKTLRIGSWSNLVYFHD